MCFIRSSSPAIAPAVKETVVRHEANADLTKNSNTNQKQLGYLQNIKTSPTGLQDLANIQSKTLLGE